MPTPNPDRNPSGGSATGRGKPSILSFFKPVAQRQPSSSPALSRALSASPVKRPVTPPSHTPIVIEASDDDGEGEGSDSYSDGSLEDLSCILARTKKIVPAEPRPQHDIYATPKAKRTAVEFHSSPLAIIPRHKFDLKALAKDARLDEATTASSLKVTEAASAAKANEHFASESATGVTIAGIVKDNGGHDARKVLRAVQRSDTSQVQPRYLFFEEDYKRPSAPVAPKLERKSPWGLLTQGNPNLRQQHLVSGLPQTILRKTGGLPDSLFEWLLDSLCIQNSVIMSQEYCNMVASCPEQVERLLTVERLQQLFIRLGAKDIQVSGVGSQFTVSRLHKEPYEGRDWSCIKSFICLLGLIAGQLSVRAAEYACQTLIRLSLDKFLICNTDVLAEFEYTIQQLTAAIPSSSWHNFCFETCSMLSHGLESRAVKITSLSCLPISNVRTHDLRRRIAVTTLFQDNTLAQHSPEDVLVFRNIIGILDTDNFTITNRTDFSELRASILLLDMVIDDGAADKFNNSNEEREFNEEVDELAGKLREIWAKTNDSGMKLARTEVKSVVEWVQQRLSLSVRTRRKAKASVFDIPREEEDPFLPKQRDYMKKFLQKTARSPAVEAAGPVEDSRDTIECRGG